MQTPHKAGFVSIIGKPNAGKSTLMNYLMGGKFSIISPKAQTTRHRIMGIISGDDYQIVYSDTPGILKPEYKLHESMMTFVNTSLEDADVILLLVELGEKFDEEVHSRILKIKAPVILVINKVDLAVGTQLEDKLNYWKESMHVADYHCISALHGEGVEELINKIRVRLPDHPAFFPKDEMTDKPERFFASEIIREKIFLNYKKEIPYCAEVEITEFYEEETIIRIRAEIYVERRSQKGIIIGKKGEALKKVGTEARLDMEEFFGKQVYLETFAKVAENWRKSEIRLKRFGYNQS